MTYLLAVIPPFTTLLSGADFLVAYGDPSSAMPAADVKVELNGHEIAGRNFTGGGAGLYYLLRGSPVLSNIRIRLTPSCGLPTIRDIPIVSPGPASNCVFPEFAPPQLTARDFTTGILTTGDFNNDGRGDVATIDPIRNQLMTFLGQTNGMLQLAGAAAARPYAINLLTADFNRDGKLDVASSQYIDIFSTPGNPPPDSKGGVTIFFGSGTGLITLNRHYDIGNGNLVSGDFNKDGAPDLAVTEWMRPNIRLRILLNNGQGQFTETPSPPTVLDNNNVGFYLAVAHINNDDNLDILLSGLPPLGRPLYQYNGDGQGGFRGVISQLPGQESFGARVFSGDFNGDGRLDPAVLFGSGDGGPQINDNALATYSGETRQFFRPAPPLLYQASSLTTADFNRDGKADLLFDNGDLFLSGSPSPYCSVIAAPTINGYQPGVRAADINGDGRLDLITSYSNLGVTGLLVSLNLSNITGSVATLSAASFKAISNTFAPEQIAALFGNNLATGTAAGRTNPLPLKLSGTEVRIRDASGMQRFAPLFYVSPTQINFLMPPDLPVGPAQIFVTNSDGITSTGNLYINQLAPGLFAANANGQGVAAAQVLRILANGMQRYEDVARFDTATNRFVAVPIDLSNASEQAFLVLCGTGYRRRPALSDIASTVGGVACETFYAGAQGSLAGLDQINLRLPRSLAGRGNVEVIVSVGGVYENTVSVNIK